MTSLLKKSWRQQKRSIQVVLSSLVLVMAAYWMFSLRYISTDDAYINANVLQVAAQATGEVVELPIKNNQFVTKGQLLFALDKASFVVAVDKAKAQLTIDQTNWHNAEVTANRAVILVKKKMLSAQTGDDVLAKLQDAAATVKLSEANLSQAELNLQHADIKAPTEGWVTNMTLRAGSVVTANQPLFALIDANEFWVDANFKETEVENIHPGQTVNIKTDMYAHRALKGVVDSISGGSGSAFSLLPAENATGNWVKVTQRFPVRVRILNVNPQYPLRIGATAAVTIDLHSAKRSS